MRVLPGRWRASLLDKALNYIALSRKAGRIELGEEPVTAAAGTGHARLIIVAADASDHTWRKAQSLTKNTRRHSIQLPYSKDELGQAIGRTELAIAAFTDAALALAFVKALNNPALYAQVQMSLEQKNQKLQRRRTAGKSDRNGGKK